MNARYLAQTGTDSASGEDGRFSLVELQEAALGGRGIISEELRQDVVERCSGTSTVTLDGEEVDISAACTAISEWDGRVTLDQAGPPVWRELIGSGVFVWDDLKDAGALFSTGFDPESPVDTPTQLAADAPVLEALATAVTHLAEAGFGPEQTLGDLQFMHKDDQDIPVPGGNFHEGTVAIAEYSSGNATLLPVETHAAAVNAGTGLNTDGYPVNYGDSFVMTMQFQDGGPHAQAIMTYSQSDDSTSEHFDDQTLLYSTSSFRDCLFDESAVSADVQEQVSLTLN